MKLFGRIENRFFNSAGDTSVVSSGAVQPSSPAPTAASLVSSSSAASTKESASKFRSPLALQDRTLSWILMLLELLGKLHLTVHVVLCCGGGGGGGGGVGCCFLRCFLAHVHII
jgi:hypothetical protein